MTKTYSGGCHCGAVRFEADLDLTKPVTHCNCTLCVRRVSSTAVVKPDALRTSGEAPAEYTRRPGGIRFFFLPHLWHPHLRPRRHPGAGAAPTPPSTSTASTTSIRRR